MDYTTLAISVDYEGRKQAGDNLDFIILKQFHH